MFPHLFSVLKPEQKRAFSSSVSLLKQTVSLRKGPHPTLYIPPPGKPTPLHLGSPPPSLPGHNGFEQQEWRWCKRQGSMSFWLARSGAASQRPQARAWPQYRIFLFISPQESAFLL